MTGNVIVFVTPQLKTGGGNRVFIELANVLAEDFQVKIICPNNSDEGHTFHLNHKVEVLPVGPLACSRINKLINLFRTISYLNKHHQESTVIISDPIFSIFACLLTMKLRYRFVQADDYSIFDDRMIISQYWLLKIYKWLTRRSYFYRLKFFFNSKYTVEKFFEAKRAQPFVADIVHPAINHAIFNPATLPQNKKELQICLVARKHPWKGLTTFLDAWNSMPELSKQRVEKIILISHDDLSEYDLPDMTILRPNADSEIARVFQESDIFISTSWWEGFGLPPLEAMACGCAVITSRSGGIDEYAVDNRNCLMFTPKSTEELKQKLIKLVDDASLRQKLINNGIADAKKFNWENSAQQLINLLSR